MEGAQVWALARMLAGQWRFAPGGGVLGFDMVAAFRMADAMAVSARAVAELLPVIGQAMAHEMSKEHGNG